MKEKKLVERCVNPFIRIAGGRALAGGLVGLMISALLGGITGYHYHGLLHFGPASNDAWWCYVAERLVVWLVPVVICYAGALLCARSRFRAVDLFGTFLFAQIPFIVMNLLYALPPMKALTCINPSMPQQEILTQPGIILAVVLALCGLPFLVLALVWMFHALKVSCNLKGGNLWVVALVGIVGGDVLCRILIKLLY